jgi:hypothetical protein
MWVAVGPFVAVLLMLALALGVFGVFALGGFAVQKRALELRPARDKPDRTKPDRNDGNDDVDTLIEELAAAPPPTPDLTPLDVRPVPRRLSSPAIAPRPRMAKGSTPPYGAPAVQPGLGGGLKSITQVADPYEDTGEIEVEIDDEAEALTEEMNVFVDPTLLEEARRRN